MPHQNGLSTEHTVDIVPILVVDDDDIDVLAIRRGLKKAGLSNPILRAHDGIEALDFLRGTGGKVKIGKPYMVLLDINMPKMNGHEVLKEIRRDTELKETIVFILSTSSDIEDTTAAYGLQAAGYIVKSTIRDGYLRLGQLLSNYWKIVSLPI
ncbi:MAG: response regulator [Kordiimonadaceae bacterium]|nr:response regulator [Kordiimonadaceae bacterium]